MVGLRARGEVVRPPSGGVVGRPLLCVEVGPVRLAIPPLRHEPGGPLLWRQRLVAPVAFLRVVGRPLALGTGGPEPMRW